MNAEPTVIRITSTKLSPTAGAYEDDGLADDAYPDDGYYASIAIEMPGEDSPSGPRGSSMPAASSVDPPWLTEAWDEPMTIWSCPGDERGSSTYAARDLNEILANVSAELELPVADVSSALRGWSERRDRERIAIGGPVRFRTIDCERVHIGWLKNLSGGGAYIETDELPPTSSLIALGFCARSAGRHHVFRSMAEVRWRRLRRGALCGGVGLRFVEPSSEAGRVLEDLIRSAR